MALERVAGDSTAGVGRNHRYRGRQPGRGKSLRSGGEEGDPKGRKRRRSQLHLNSKRLRPSKRYEIDD